MTPAEEAEYIRRREARDARRRELDAAAGYSDRPVRAATKAWVRQQAIKRRHRNGARPAH